MTWWRRRWVQLLGVGVLALGVGAVAGSSSASSANHDRDKARRALASARTELQQAIADKESAEKAAATAAAHARADLASRFADLRRRQEALTVAENRFQRKVNGYEQSAVAGTGTYLVGKDIKPGIYRAASSPGCYWARLSSLDTNDIIDNDNADGPVVVEIRSSDVAFEAEGCATFHRISG